MEDATRHQTGVQATSEELAKLRHAFTTTMTEVRAQLPDDDDDEDIGDLLARLDAIDSALADVVRRVVLERSQTIRQVQVDRLHRTRLIEGLPTVDVRAADGQRFTKLVEDPAQLEDLDCPGATAWVSMELKHVLGVQREIPPELELGSVEDVFEIDGRPAVLVQDQNGSRPITKSLAWNVDPKTVVAGRSVYWKGGFVYLVRSDEADANAFLDQRKLTAGDVRINEVFGPEQRRAIVRVLAALDEAVRGDPARAQANGRPLLLIGDPGLGKSHLLEACAGELLRGVPGAGAYSLGADEFAHWFVGKSQQRIRDLFSTINYRAAAGAPQFVVIEEIESLAASRETTSRYLDGGSSMKNLNSVLAQLESVHSRLHPNAALCFTSNLPQTVDEALTQRCHVVPVTTFGPEEFLRTIQLWVGKQQDWYSCRWEDGLMQACRAALGVVIGMATVGKQPVAVRLATVLSGRLARKAHERATEQVREERYLARWRRGRAFDGAPEAAVDPALLCTSIVAEAIHQVGTWSLATARRRLEGTEVCSRGRADAIESLEVHPVEQVGIVADLDGRERLARMEDQIDDTLDLMAQRGVWQRAAG